MLVRTPIAAMSASEQVVTTVGTVHHDFTELPDGHLAYARHVHTDPLAWGPFGTVPVKVGAIEEVVEGDPKAESNAVRIYDGRTDYPDHPPTPASTWLRTARPETGDHLNSLIYDPSDDI